MSARLALAFALVLDGAIAVAQPSPSPAPERVLLKTTQGDLLIELFPEVAPRHVAQFLKLVSLGVYDSTRFLRVERGFLVQVGIAQSRRLPLSDSQRAAIVKLPVEISTLKHKRGVLSMAHDEKSLDSAETSFAVLLDEAPFLDGEYTIFGRVIAGLEVADAMSQAEVDFGKAPIRPIEIEEARMVGRGDVVVLRASSGPPPARERAGRHVVWFVSVMCALLLGALALLGRVPSRVTSALLLLALFTGFFLLYTLLVQAGTRSRALSLAILIATFLFIRLVSGFEKPKS